MKMSLEEIMMARNNPIADGLRGMIQEFLQKDVKQQATEEKEPPMLEPEL